MYNIYVRLYMIHAYTYTCKCVITHYYNNKHTNYRSGDQAMHAVHVKLRLPCK